MYLRAEFGDLRRGVFLCGREQTRQPLQPRRGTHLGWMKERHDQNDVVVKTYLHDRGTAAAVE